MKQNRLLKLIHDNVAGKEVRKIRMEATDGDAHIYLYDVIDAWFGASVAGLIEALAGAAGKVVHLHINSPGGDIFEARAMAAAISSFEGKVIGHIDGVAASAATYPALACSELRITDGGMLMIHNSMTLAYGNKDDLLSTADLLAKIDTTIASTYMQKTGASADEVASWMNAETWFTAQEALDAGFVDAVDASTKVPTSNWDLSAYNNAPKMPAPVVVDPELALTIDNQMVANRNRMRLLQL